LAVGDRYVIFAKVRMLDLCYRLERRDNFAAFQRVVGKHVDFVVCDPESTRPLVVFELDDPSHLRPDRVARDKFVDGVFAMMGLVLLHQPVAPSYDSVRLAGRIGKVLSPASTKRPGFPLRP